MVAVLLASTLALAQERGPQSSVRTAGRFGIGIGAGTSTAGLSGKYFFDESKALQAVLGAGYGQNEDKDGWSSGLGVGADLLFEGPSFGELDDVEFGWSIGPGVGVWAFEDQFAMAVAGVAGLELCVLVFPVDFVIEYRPRMLLVPELGFDWVNLSAHARYYFK